MDEKLTTKQNYRLDKIEKKIDKLDKKLHTASSKGFIDKFSNFLFPTKYSISLIYLRNPLSQSF